MARRLDPKPLNGLARSGTRGLRHRSSSGGRPVERAVHLLEGAALGFGAEHPEADHAENVPGCEIDERRAEHDEVRRCRLDDVARPHDHRQAGRPQVQTLKSLSCPHRGKPPLEDSDDLIADLGGREDGSVYKLRPTINLTLGADDYFTSIAIHADEALGFLNLLHQILDGNARPPFVSSAIEPCAT